MNAAATSRDRGDTAQVSERSFGGDPVRVVAGAGQELACHLRPDVEKGEQLRRHLPNQLGDLVIGFGDLLAQQLMPASEATQRGLGGMVGIAELLSRTQPGTDGDDLGRPQVSQLLPELGWAGDDQSLDLVRGLTTGFDCAGLGHAQCPDRLDATIAQLRHHRRRARQHCPGGWYADGLLIIGDAAHAMSPVGGVGINLAIQDALAAGRIVGPKLANKTLTRATLRRVQLRRWAPTALTQTLQRAAHRVLQARLSTAGTEQAAATDLPLPARLLRRFPLLRAIPALLVGLGVLPEHAPPWAMSQVSKAR